ncbi:hypothetical protein BH11PSE11_BH11PSE11_23330 [soil metagenome]
MESRMKSNQHGLSLVGLIFILAILASIGILGLKVVPTYSEYRTIKEAIVTSKEKGTTVSGIKAAFDKQADVSYITAISSKDLEFSQNGTDVDVSFAYQKKIPLFGPASLLLEYEGTTAKVQPKSKKTIE